MLGIAEIGLTIWASIRFRQAGKCWALGLVPINVGFLGGILIGIILGLFGLTATSPLVVAFGIIIDLVVIGVLIYLIVTNKPKTISSASPKE